MASRHRYDCKPLHLAIAGTAFLFLAGYTYLDTYRRYLGLGFAVTEVSTAEVLVQGYVVLWFALFDRIWHVLAVLVLPSAIAIVVVIGLALLIRHGRRRGWRWCEIAADRIMAIPDRASALPNYLFTFAIVTAVLVVAQPAGDRAVRREYQATIDKVKRGCCFCYTMTSGQSVAGYQVASSPDRLFVMTRSGVRAIPAEDIVVSNPVPLTARSGRSTPAPRRP